MGSIGPQIPSIDRGRPATDGDLDRERRGEPRGPDARRRPPLAARDRDAHLVLHARGDSTVKFESALDACLSIPNARLIPLDSSNDILLADEPAWALFLRTPPLQRLPEAQRLRKGSPDRGGRERRPRRPPVARDRTSGIRACGRRKPPARRAGGPKWITAMSRSYVPNGGSNVNMWIPTFSPGGLPTSET